MWTLTFILFDVLPIAAQDSTSSPIVRSAPDPLIEGTVGWLQVRAAADSLLGGHAAGEPIQFQRLGDDEYRGMIGIPLETSDSLRVLLFLSRQGRIDTVHAAVPIASAGYPRETIRVAPGFAKPNATAAARIKRENAQSRGVSLASRNRPRLWDGPFQIPREARTTSVFGAARVYNGEVRSRHTGTDFAGAIGAPVAAAGRGVVALVADFYLAGKAVYIDHGGGLVTAYFHLSQSDVSQGDTVTAGQRIGAVGQSGRVTGPHLHWVARYGVISVDPMSLIKLESVTAEK
jgi:murein DD-endopeptidase MepM/ murein hydrolase activator NlpD